MGNRLRRPLSLVLNHCSATCFGSLLLDTGDKTLHALKFSYVFMLMKFCPDLTQTPLYHFIVWLNSLIFFLFYWGLTLVRLSAQMRSVKLYHLTHSELEEPSSLPPPVNSPSKLASILISVTQINFSVPKLQRNMISVISTGLLHSQMCYSFFLWEVVVSHPRLLTLIIRNSVLG